MSVNTKKPVLTDAAHRLIVAATELQKELDTQGTTEAPAAYTRDGFCRAHAISKSFYLKLRAAGLGPDELNLGMGTGQRGRPRITVEAAAEWRKKMAARALSGGR
jgi:hypothetical protein